MSNDLRPVYLTDKLTFCTYLFQACLEKDAVDPANKRKFVEDCADNFPTTALREIPGTPYKWNFNGDAALAEQYGYPPSRNFMLWNTSPISTPSNGMGHDYLRDVANDFSNYHCDKFGTEDRAHQASEETHHAVDANKLIFQGIEPGFWETLGIGVGVLALGVVGFLTGASFTPLGANGFSGTTTPWDPTGKNPLQI